jgi:hypothetical protein
MDLSFPKIISERIGDVIRPVMGLQRSHQSAGSLAAMAHPVGVTDAGAFHCNKQHNQRAHRVSGVRQNGPDESRINLQQAIENIDGPGRSATM